MSRVFDAKGKVTPVTVIQAGPVTVTQVKEESKNGYNAVQVGFVARKAKNISKAERGHLKELDSFNVLKEFRISAEALQEFSRGKKISAEIFTKGDYVDVIGISKGRGFAGVVKRHHFSGSPASHGHKDQLRMPGSIGAQQPQRVLKGKRMAGHFGVETVTVKNLEVVDLDGKNNLMKVKGAVPGARNGLLIIRSAKNAPKKSAPAAVKKSKK